MNNTLIKTRRLLGYTLIEMVLSLTILGVISASVGSVVMLAAQSEPADDSVAATLVTDSRALARIAEDLAMAKYVIEQTPNAVTIVVADRTGDGLPDRLRYAWSGVASTPLTFQLNDESATTMLSSIDSFNLSYTYNNRTATVPAASSTDGPEILLSDHDVAPTMQWPLNATRAVGQRFTPTLNAGATGFKVTRIQMMACSAGGTDGQIPVSIKDISGNTPGNTVYATNTLLESSLTSAGGWFEVVFPSSQVVPAGQETVVEIGLGSGSGSHLKMQISGQGTSPYVYTMDSNSSWHAESGEYLPYRVYGTEALPGTGYDLTREHVTRIDLSLKSTADGRSPMTRSVNLEQAPEVLTNLWDADFNTSPTGGDLNGDGSPDWSYNPGGAIPAGHLINGAWTAHDTLAIQPAGALPDVVRVVARMCAGNATENPTLHGPFHSDGAGNVLPLVTVLQQDGSGGQELLIYNEHTPTTPIATIGGLSADWVDVQLTLLPQEQVLWVKVNGEDKGAAVLNWEADQGARGVWFEGTGLGAKFFDVRVTFGGSYVPNASAPTYPLGGAADQGANPLQNNSSNTSSNWWENLFR